MHQKDVRSHDRLCWERVVPQQHRLGEPTHDHWYGWTQVKGLFDGPASASFSPSPSGRLRASSRVRRASCAHPAVVPHTRVGALEYREDVVAAHLTLDGQPIAS